MSPLEPSNKYYKVIKIQDKDLKIGFVNVIEVLKEKMSNLLKDVHENKNSKEKKSVQDRKVKIESIKKSQTEQNLEMKNLGTLTGTSEASLINGKQKIEERTSGIEDTVENMDSSKKVLNTKKIFKMA